MSSIELTPSQKTILQELINLFRESESAVKGEDIAEKVDRNPGTPSTSWSAFRLCI